MSRIGAFVVTGAGQGIGQAIAQTLIAKGHRVFGLGRTLEKLKATAALLPPETFSFEDCDLTSLETTNSSVLKIRQWLKDQKLPLLGLVNNAGVYDRVSFNDSDDELWQRQFDNNLLSAVRLTRLLQPDLASSAPSSVLNISSTLGIRPIKDTSAYSAIKAAMINWTQTLALEWAPVKIRVNVIAPGLTDTPIHAFHSKPESDSERKFAHGAQPLGRMGTAEDIALAAAFLLSEDSKWTTGSILSVDGGIQL